MATPEQSTSDNKLSSKAIAVQLKSDKIMPLGGIYPLIREFEKIEPLIDSELGSRGKAGSYQYGEITKALMCDYFCGGERIEDIKTHKEGLEYMPDLRICSPDTILRAIDELKVDNVILTSDRKKDYAFNNPDKLNELLVKAAIQQGQLIPGRRYVLDFDHKFIEADKYDAQYSFKKAPGYWAAVAVLTDLETGEDVIIGIEGLDGNTNVKFHQAEILTRYYVRLKAHGIIPVKTRCDCGSYAEEIITVIGERGGTFYIRANMYQALEDELNRHTNWTKAKLEDCYIETLSLPFISIPSIKHCRLVVQRTKVDKPNLFTEYVYRAILTNDWEFEEVDVVNFYNQRGAKEKVFDQMDNDFGWNYLPKSFLNSNTVFMVLTAIIRNFYCAILNKKRILAFGLTSKSRMKSFISKYIAVPAKWIKHAGTSIVNLYTNRQAYHEIFNLGFG